MAKAYEVPRVFLLDNQRDPTERFTRPPRERARDRRPGMSPPHLERIRQLACTVCYETRGIHAHHLRSGDAARERGIGLKAVDKRTLPLCWAHHDELHRYGSRREADWFQKRGINPYLLVNGLWNVSSDRDEDSLDRMRSVLKRHKEDAFRWLADRFREARGS
jgi:hypothetical protein